MTDTLRTRTDLKLRFETGDIPTGSDYNDWITTMATQSGSNTFSSDPQVFLGDVTINGNVSASGFIGASMGPEAAYLPLSGGTMANDAVINMSEGVLSNVLQIGAFGGGDGYINFEERSFFGSGWTFQQQPQSIPGYLTTADAAATYQPIGAGVTPDANITGQTLRLTDNDFSTVTLTSGFNTLQLYGEMLLGSLSAVVPAGTQAILWNSETKSFVSVLKGGPSQDFGSYNSYVLGPSSLFILDIPDNTAPIIIDLSQPQYIGSAISTNNFNKIDYAARDYYEFTKRGTQLIAKTFDPLKLHPFSTDSITLNASAKELVVREKTNTFFSVESPILLTDLSAAAINAGSLLPRATNIFVWDPNESVAGGYTTYTYLWPINGTRDDAFWHQGTDVYEKIINPGDFVYIYFNAPSPDMPDPTLKLNLASIATNPIQQTTTAITHSDLRALNFARLNNFESGVQRHLRKNMLASDMVFLTGDEVRLVSNTPTYFTPKGSFMLSSFPVSANGSILHTYNTDVGDYTTYTYITPENIWVDEQFADAGSTVINSSDLTIIETPGSYEVFNLNDIQYIGTPNNVHIASHINGLKLFQDSFKLNTTIKSGGDDKTRELNRFATTSITYLSGSPVVTLYPGSPVVFNPYKSFTLGALSGDNALPVGSTVYTWQNSNSDDFSGNYATYNYNFASGWGSTASQVISANSIMLIRIPINSSPMTLDFSHPELCGPFTNTTSYTSNGYTEWVNHLALNDLIPNPGKRVLNPFTTSKIRFQNDTFSPGLSTFTFTGGLSSDGASHYVLVDVPGIGVKGLKLFDV